MAEERAAAVASKSFAGKLSAEAEAAEVQRALAEEKRINKAYEDMSVQELRRCAEELGC